jgi:hypothetical protein
MILCRRSLSSGKRLNRLPVERCSGECRLLDELSSGTECHFLPIQLVLTLFATSLTAIDRQSLTAALPSVKFNLGHADRKSDLNIGVFRLTFVANCANVTHLIAVI